MCKVTQTSYMVAVNVTQSLELAQSFEVASNHVCGTNTQVPLLCFYLK